MRHIRYSIFMVFFISIGLYSQQSCKVLVPEIAEKYVGKCKKGFAHGKGLAVGIDRYEGSFKKGYPEGKGSYTWSTGEVYTGEWLQGTRMVLGLILMRKMASLLFRKAFGRMMFIKDPCLKNHRF